ncbi:MAG: response regulator [Mariprofundales bacterium]|nr:response regulator [Mariprofundales bacterium]
MNNNSTFTTLLIEDNMADARLVEEAFKESKLLVNLQICTNGEEAVELLMQLIATNQPLPDMIMLDLNLPGMDGKEVLAKIKQQPTLKRVPVVILTTSQADRDIVQSYNLSANAYVIKPLDFDQFMTIIRETAQFWLTIAVLPNGRTDD